MSKVRLVFGSERAVTAEPATAPRVRCVIRRGTGSTESGMGHLLRKPSLGKAGKTAGKIP